MWWRMTSIKLWDVIGALYLAALIGLFLWLVWKRM